MAKWPGGEMTSKRKYPDYNVSGYEEAQKNIRNEEMPICEGENEEIMKEAAEESGWKRQKEKT